MSYNQSKKYPTVPKESFIVQKVHWLGGVEDETEKKLLYLIPLNYGLEVEDRGVEIIMRFTKE